MWSYVFGPFLALLPARLRTKWFADRNIQWRSAAIISGAMQFVAGPFVLALWEAFITTSIGRSIATAAGLQPIQLQGSGPFQMFFLVVSFVNPITWILFYLFVEGAFRGIAAGIAGETLGTLPLFAIDQGYLFVRRKVWDRPPPMVRDLVTQDDSRADWQLKIESCRAKGDWNVGKLLRYENRYYRIESYSQEGGARPFVFLLRAVAAGVPSYSVILYSPETPAPARPALSAQNS
jgi:hypothetical protein